MLDPSIPQRTYQFSFSALTQQSSLVSGILVIADRLATGGTERFGLGSTPSTGAADVLTAPPHADRLSPSSQMDGFLSTVPHSQLRTFLVGSMRKCDGPCRLFLNAAALVM
jgi:hypothetical protein